MSFEVVRELIEQTSENTARKVVGEVREDITAISERMLKMELIVNPQNGGKEQGLVFRVQGLETNRDEVTKWKYMALGTWFALTTIGCLAGFLYRIGVLKA